MTAAIHDGLTKSQRHRQRAGRNPKAAEYVAAWRARNPGVGAAINRKWYLENVESQRARAKRYYETVRKKKHGTPEWRAKERMKKARRRAMKAGVECTLTWAEWTVVCEQHEYRCAYCKTKLANPEQDHVIPISKGGSHTKENVVPACTSCNASKGDRDKPLWMRG